MLHVFSCRSINRSRAATRAGWLFIVALDEVDHQHLVRETLAALPCEHDIAFDADLKDPLFALDEFSIDADFFFYSGRQTGGLREIVSLRAVLDRDMHGGLLVLVKPTSMAEKGVWPRLWQCYVTARRRVERSSQAASDAVSFTVTISLWPTGDRSSHRATM